MTSKKTRNRHRQAGFMFPTPLAGILLSAAVMALSYLWLGGKCEALGRNIKILERECAELCARRTNEESKWSWMITPGNMEIALKRHRLDMDWPDGKRLVIINYSESRTSAKQLGWHSDDQEQMQVAMND